MPKSARMSVFCQVVTQACVFSSIHLWVIVSLFPNPLLKFDRAMERMDQNTGVSALLTLAKHCISSALTVGSFVFFLPACLTNCAASYGLDMLGNVVHRSDSIQLEDASIRVMR